MIQEIINKLYRYPKSDWKEIKRFGGIINYQQMIRGQKMMMKAYKNLPTVPSSFNGLPIYFLTGKKFIYQTLFCAYSLVKHSSEVFQFVLVDDGTFNLQDIEFLKAKMPNVRLVLREEINSNLNLILPKNKFPFLHNKRKVYPHIKKLTDIHTIKEHPFKLVLDSDMLFWKNPSEIINWMKTPNGVIYMLDCEESYGYSRNLMSALSGNEIPSLVNVGTIGFSSEIVDWIKLEEWGETLEKQEGTSYYLEQALTAMLICDQESEILDRNEYKVNPSVDEIKHTKGTLHHYVDLSKEGYFKFAWKNIL